MAILEKIVVQDYRNIALAELEFSANINCISGGNGEGKTNLLDAVWYLSMTKSAFRSSDRDNPCSSLPVEVHWTGITSGMGPILFPSRETI